MKHIFILLVISFLFSACSADKENNQNYLILISMDGFRWDYTNSVATLNFDKIEKMGVKAESMKVSFPSKTFPNHYTIVTGLYPDHHGIVNNTFYVPEYDEIYAIGNRKAVQDGKFYGGEPIWNTAEKQGLKAASYFWVGSEANIQNKLPSYWKVYDHHFDFYQRVDSVFYWLNLNKELRPNLICLYFAEPDGIGHKAGPKSLETDSTIRKLDLLLGYFLDKLNNHPLKNKINVILTSDHGMGALDEEKVVYLVDYLKPEWTQRIIGGNPNWNIEVAPNFSDSVYNNLKDLEGISIYKNPEVPKHLHYGTNPRCLDYTVFADSSYSLHHTLSSKHYSKGAHGYDINNKDMNAIFYAFGPAFKNNYQQKEFSNTSLYPLMCRILEIVPAPNDGDYAEVKDMLKSH
jgi:predicted AlkP superfamily pyrophosphatase or phosphodiesterase